MKNWAIYHECTPDVIENIMKDFPVAYLPWGAIGTTATIIQLDWME